MGILDASFGPGDSVLDIGCGVGKWVKYLIEKNVNCIGIDSSKMAIKRAKSLLRTVGKEETVSIGDALRLKFQEESFDGIVSFGLLEHFPNHEEILRRWMLMVRKGGRLVLTVPNANRLDWLIWNALWVNVLKSRRWIKVLPRSRGFITTFHGYEERWTPTYFKRVCRRAGLKTVISKTIFTLPAPLFYHLSNRLPSHIFQLMSSDKESKTWGLYIVVVAQKQR